MKSKDDDIRRKLLKPLIRRDVYPAQTKRMKKVVMEFEQWAIANYASSELATSQREAQTKYPPEYWQDRDIAKSQIEFAYALYVARKISLEEYIFRASMLVEGVHEGRMNGQSYPDLLAITSAMKKIQEQYGLGKDEHWLLKDAPKEYLLLDKKWRMAANKRFLECFLEIEGNVAAHYLQKDRSRFDILRERGRRSFFHKDETIDALIDTIKRYEREARSAAANEAYTAAVTLLGAASEGLLLLRCLQSKKKAMEASQRLEMKFRPKREITRWTFDQLIRVCLECGWLPEIHLESIVIIPNRLADHLRRMRNHIHPGRVSTEFAWIQVELRDYEDAELIYTTLFTRVFKGSLLRQFSNKDSLDT